MSSHPAEQDSPHMCKGCGTIYGEYVNGCPKCWDDSLSREENLKKFPERGCIPIDRGFIEFLSESNAIEGVYDSESLQQAIVAWDYLMTEKKMSIGVVLKTHKILMLKQRGLYPDEKGYFRHITVYIGGKAALNAMHIREKMDNWVEAMNVYMPLGKNGNNAESLERRSKGLHVEYEKIHPFVDGNGRTGRMFMNWWRLRNGLPILTIHEGDEQMEYYKWFS